MTVPLMDEQELLERSPFLLKLQKRRLAPVRWAQLLATAQSSKPPKEPEPWDCCGSSCQPCVKELYRQEKRVWDEIHPDGSDEEHDDDGELGQGGDDKEKPAPDTPDNDARKQYKDAEQQKAKPRIEIDLATKLGNVSLTKPKAKELCDDW
ncbi:hypothetical protein ACM66B_002619 [Microbotryomycetes sp. NB124-2]